MILELKQMQCALGSELWFEYNKVSLPHIEVQPRLNSKMDHPKMQRLVSTVVEI